MNVIHCGAHPGLLPAAYVLLLAACSQNAPLEGRSTTLQSGESSTADVLEREEMTIKVTSMEELLANRVRGVIVRRSGGDVWIEVRGPTSVTSPTEALVIIDGIQSSSRGLLAMSPDNVQRIEVLKGASAAIYGVRGGNGVLVVTTRQIGE